MQDLVGKRYIVYGVASDTSLASESSTGSFAKMVARKES